jgi:hypothetical protein
MSPYWVSLPSAWDLADVQAFCTIVVTALCSLFAFVFTQLCWQTAAGRVLKNRSIRLYHLLNVTTIGEAYDACLMLGHSILAPKHWGILFQCIVISAFVVIGILSGLVVRYSTQLTSQSLSRPVQGLLANRYSSGSSHATLAWHSTYEALGKAQFPQDRLPDFLPSDAVPWTYEVLDWANSTWSMECDYTKEKAINLTVVNMACSENTTMVDQIPALEQVFPFRSLKSSPPSYSYTQSEGFQDRETLKWTDTLMFRTTYTFALGDNASEVSNAIDLTLGSIYMKGLQGAPPDDKCVLLPGGVDRAYYTKAFCKIRRQIQTPAGKFFIDAAYPDNISLEFLAKAYVEYFMNRLDKYVYDGSLESKDSVTIKAFDLVRFYQTYTITHSTTARHVIDRPIHVRVNIVQVSTIFLAITGSIALLTLIGLFKYMVFVLRHRNDSQDIPQSKLDWMAQAVPRESRQSRLSISQAGGSVKKGYFASEVILSSGTKSSGHKVGRSFHDTSAPSSFSRNPLLGISSPSPNGSGYFPLMEGVELNRVASRSGRSSFG